MNTNLLVYYQLPSQIAVEEHDKILSSFTSSIIDDLGECGPLIVVEAQIDEIRNALRDKLIERGVSREAKIKSASRLVKDFEELLERLSQIHTVLYLEEDSELYRKAHGVYQRIKRDCHRKIKSRKSMQRDSMLIAVAGLYDAILVTRDKNLYKAVECLHSRGSKEYSSIWIHVDSSRKTITVLSCTRIEPPCILMRINRILVDLNMNWQIKHNRGCQ